MFFHDLLFVLFFLLLNENKAQHNFSMLSIVGAGIEWLEEKNKQEDSVKVVELRGILRLRAKRIVDFGAERSKVSGQKNFFFWLVLDLMSF